MTNEGDAVGALQFDQENKNIPQLGMQLSVEMAIPSVLLFFLEYLNYDRDRKAAGAEESSKENPEMIAQDENANR